MDPVTAFGIASGVAQLISFSIQIATLCKDFKAANGALPVDLVRIETLIQDLQPLLLRIQQKVSQDVSLNEPSFAALLDLGLSEIKAIHKILSSLAKPPSKADPFHLRNALAAVFKSGKLAESEEILMRLRSSLNLRLTNAILEKQQYACEILDRSRLDASQSFQTVRGTLDILISSIRNTADVVSSDINSLVLRHAESKSALELLTQEIVRLDEHVQDVSRRLCDERRQPPLQMPAILQLQSASRLRASPRRHRSSSRPARYRRPSRSTALTATKTRNTGSRSSKPALQFSISVSVHGHPRDLLVVLRNMILTSWYDVLRPIVSPLFHLGQQIHIPPTASDGAITAMLRQSQGKTFAKFDASNGLFLMSSDIMTMMGYIPRQNMITSRPEKRLTWSMEVTAGQDSFFGLKMKSIDLSCHSTTTTTGVSIEQGDSMSSGPLDESLLAEPLVAELNEPDEWRNLSEAILPLHYDETEPFISDRMKNRSSTDDSQMDQLDLDGQVQDIPTQSRTECIAIKGKSARRRAKPRRKPRSPWRVLLRLFLICIPLIFLGKWLDGVGSHSLFETSWFNDIPFLRSQFYGDVAVMFQAVKSEVELDAKVTEEVRLIHKHHDQQKRKARAAKMKQRALRCTTWGRCTKWYLDEMWDHMIRY